MGFPVPSISDPASCTAVNARRAVRAAGEVLLQLCLRVDGHAGPKPGPAVGAGVRASPGRDRQTGLQEPDGTGRAFHGRAAADPFGRRSLRLPAAMRSGPSRRWQSHLSMQAVEPRDIGGIPTGHGAAGDPPDRRPEFGQTPQPVPSGGRPAAARRRRCAPHRPARRQGDLPQRLRHRPRRAAR